MCFELNRDFGAPREVLKLNACHYLRLARLRRVFGPIAIFACNICSSIDHEQKANTLQLGSRSDWCQHPHMDLLMSRLIYPGKSRPMVTG
jgi:hypothetical protein